VANKDYALLEVFFLDEYFAGDANMCFTEYEEVYMQ